jgi:hypothetical protein
MKGVVGTDVDDLQLEVAVGPDRAQHLQCVVAQVTVGV